MEELKVDGEVKVTYLDSYTVTGEKTTVIHCICGRGEVCDNYKESGIPAGMFCSECEHLIELTDAEAARIVKEQKDTVASEGITTKWIKPVDWLSTTSQISHGCGRKGGACELYMESDLECNEYCTGCKHYVTHRERNKLIGG